MPERRGEGDRRGNGGSGGWTATGDPGLDDVDRPALRRAVLRHHPWVGHTTWGPQTVTAGECDVCGEEARLVQPCGPPPDAIGLRATPEWALGRRCALQLGVEGWCDGHADEAADALAWLAALPTEADDIARLWWIATGEVRPSRTEEPAGGLRQRAEELLAEN